MLAYGVSQQVVQLLSGFFDAAPADLRWRPPIRVKTRFPINPLQQMPWRKFLYAFNHAVGSRNVVQAQEAIQTVNIEAALNCSVLQDCFDFGGKEDVLSNVTEIKRFYADAIPSQHEALFGFGPDRQRKHSSKAGETLNVPFAKCMQHDFRVAGRYEPIADVLKEATQFGVIINFAVEHQDGVTIITDNRLIASDKVNDPQAYGA